MADTLDPQPGQNWQDPVTQAEFVWVETLGVWAGKHTVTNGEFRQFSSDHSSGEFEGHAIDGDRQPVVMVSFNDAMDYCEWLRDTALDAGVSSNLIVRLPSHTDWTALASCGRPKRYPWGDDWPPAYGNDGDEAAKRVFNEWDIINGYDDGHAVSCPVEESGENEWGLFGVAGNVYEWTFEANGTGTELRGGSWSTYQKPYLKLGNRLPREPSSRLVNFGFRVIVSI